MRHYLYAIATALTLGVVPQVIAQSPPDVVCTGLVGCGSGPANILLGYTLPALIRLLVNLAGAGSVIFIIVAGAQMMLANGDEGKTTQARWAIFYALAGLLLALTAQILVEFVATENYVSGVGGDPLLGFLQSVVRIALILVNVTFTIVIIIAGIRLVTAGGNHEDFQKGLTIIRWAITGAIVINLSRALVEALLNLNL